MGGLGPDTSSSPSIRYANVGRVFTDGGLFFYFDLEVSNVTSYENGVGATPSGLEGSFARISVAPNTQTTFRISTRPSCATQDSCQYCELGSSASVIAACYARGCGCFGASCTDAACCQGAERESKRLAYTCPAMNNPLLLPPSSLVALTVYDLESGGASATEYVKRVIVDDYRYYKTPLRPASDNDVLSTLDISANATTFSSTTSGSDANNPSSPTNLTDDQASKGVQFFFNPQQGFIEAAYALSYSGSGTGVSRNLLLGGDSALCTPPPPPPPSPPNIPPSPPPDILVQLSGESAAAPNPNVSVGHDTPTTITFDGDHPLDAGDVVAFVPLSDGGCANALNFTSIDGGTLDANLSVTVHLQGGVDGTDSGTYVLCLAEAPPGGFPGGLPTVGDFHYHPHVSIQTLHAPPSTPPIAPPSSPPDIAVYIDLGGANVSGTPDLNVSLPHDTPTVIVFTGNHSLEEGDVIVFVPVTDGGCANAANAPASDGGPLDASLSVTLQLQGGVDGTDSGIYVLCVAEAPPGGFPGPGGRPTASDFDYHPHVFVTTVHAPPAAPPLPPAAPSPLQPDLSLGLTSNDIGDGWIVTIIAIAVLLTCCWWYLIFALWRRRREEQDVVAVKTPSMTDLSVNQTTLNTEPV